MFPAAAAAAAAGGLHMPGAPPLNSFRQCHNDANQDEHNGDHAHLMTEFNAAGGRAPQELFEGCVQLAMRLSGRPLRAHRSGDGQATRMVQGRLGSDTKQLTFRLASRVRTTSKALNRDYGAVNVASTKELKKLVNALVQQQCNRDKSEDACNNCGKKGHWRRECPELNGNKKFNSRNKSDRNVKI